MWYCTTVVTTAEILMLVLGETRFDTPTRSIIVSLLNVPSLVSLALFLTGFRGFYLRSNMIEAPTLTTAVAHLAPYHGLSIISSLMSWLVLQTRRLGFGNLGLTRCQ